MIHRTPLHGMRGLIIRISQLYSIKSRGDHGFTPCFHTKPRRPSPHSVSHTEIPYSESRQGVYLTDLRNERKARETIAQCPDKPAVACTVRKSLLR